MSRIICRSDESDKTGRKQYSVLYSLWKGLEVSDQYSQRYKSLLILNVETGHRGGRGPKAASRRVKLDAL